MWWSPTNERESALANDVQLLRNWFVEREVFTRTSPNRIWGWINLEPAGAGS